MANNTIILTPSSFAQGSFQEVAVSDLLTQRLQETINRWEVYYIMLLLSNQVTTQYPVGLGQAFINECNANTGNYKPTSTRMLNIYNPFYLMSGRMLKDSKGITDLLLDAIFYHYITDKTWNDSQGGVVSPQVDAAKKGNSRVAFRFAESRYNDMLETFDNIQWYIRSGDGTNLPGHGGALDYPEYIQGHRPRAIANSILG